jgi:hypothetical protein
VVAGNANWLLLTEKSAASVERKAQRQITSRILKREKILFLKSRKERNNMCDLNNGKHCEGEGLCFKVGEEKPKVRTFESGATRDTDQDKFDYEGFLSPLVLERFAEYMHKNRVQSDGSLRDSDNWQKGIPEEQYMKSKFRHFMETWKLHRKQINYGVDYRQFNLNLELLEESLCAEMFNTMGFLHQLLRGKPDRYQEEKQQEGKL